VSDHLYTGDPIATTATTLSSPAEPGIPDTL